MQILEESMTDELLNTSKMAVLDAFNDFIKKTDAIPQQGYNPDIMDAFCVAFQRISDVDHMAHEQLSEDECAKLEEYRYELVDSHWSKIKTKLPKPEIIEMDEHGVWRRIK